MKVECSVQIISMKTIKEMPNSWSKQDYLHILNQLGYKNERADSGTRDLVNWALSDQESKASAQMLLSYKLKQHLTNDQIQQLSYDMHTKKLSEQYPDIFIQRELFNINQLLFSAYKGHYPECKAIELEMTLKVTPISCMKDEQWMNEIIIKALTPKLNEQSALMKLYKLDLCGKNRFPDASGILWKTEVSKSMDGCFDIRIYSSEYWLSDLRASESFETTIEVLES